MDAADKQGLLVAINFSLVFGVPGGQGGSWRKVVDRIWANAIALIFVLILLDLAQLKDLRSIVGIAIPWIFGCFLIRTPDALYRWTCTGYQYVEI